MRRRLGYTFKRAQETAQRRRVMFKPSDLSPTEEMVNEALDTVTHDEDDPWETVCDECGNVLELCECVHNDCMFCHSNPCECTQIIASEMAANHET